MIVQLFFFLFVAFSDSLVYVHCLNFVGCYCQFMLLLTLLLMSILLSTLFLFISIVVVYSLLRCCCSS